MKSIRTNGTARRAAKTTTTKPAKTLRELRLIETFRRIDAEDPKRRAKEKAASVRRYKATKTLTVTLSADIYGFLYAAAVINDTSPEIVTSAFLQQRITEWANNDFMLED
jgi:hypothetical protein